MSMRHPLTKMKTLLSLVALCIANIAFADVYTLYSIKGPRIC